MPATAGTLCQAPSAAARSAAASTSAADRASFLHAGVAVPGDVSVVGYDDDRLSGLPHVNLTTIAQDAPSPARLAVERRWRALARRS